jgi:hypothetical protein
MKSLIATTLIAFALATPAMAFDISAIDGIPSDMKDMIAKQSSGRVTNKQSQQGSATGWAGWPAAATAGRSPGAQEVERTGQSDAAGRPVLERRQHQPGPR